eukprot:6255499-Alexandrium_andersonii.AAC.1
MEWYWQGPDCVKRMDHALGQRPSAQQQSPQCRAWSNAEEASPVHRRRGPGARACSGPHGTRAR